MYRKVLFLSLILFLLMGFACAENPVDADSGFNVSNSSEVQLTGSFSNDSDILSSQSCLDEDNVHVLSSTHVVDEGTFSSIEDAITSSNPGDTIYLGNKRYVGDGSAIHVDRDHLKFVGESKSNKATLDPRGLGRIFNVKQAADITFKNIRFINGKYENEGSGIVSFGTVHIEDCEFINNTGDSGTCIFLSQDADDSTIINCTFTNNKALYGWDGWAEGAAIDSHVSNTKIINCTFKNNFAVNSGGAIALRNGKNNIIRNCVFTNNTSPIAGAVYLKNTTTQIINSKFKLNKATDTRGGALAISDSSVVIDGSNFTSNSADYGGAIYNFPGSDLTVKNSNFIKNNADNGGCIYSNGELSINNSNFTNNECKNGKAIIYSTKPAKITYSSFASNSKDTNSYLLYLNCDKNTISNNNFERNQKAVYALNNNGISFNNFKNNKNGLILKNNNKIYSNRFSGNDVAINSSNNNQIYSNTFENNKFAVDSGDKNKIFSNVFLNNSFGINSGNNNEISFNNFSNNEKSLFSNNKNNILNNTFKNNKIGVVLKDNNVLSFNVFYNNSLALKAVNTNKIRNNSFSHNENGVQLAGSSNELFTNSFSYNTIGIHLIKSNSNLIKSNSFSNNYQNSIKGTGSKNRLKGNNFTNNGLSGKYCNVYIKGSENKASNNIFKNNKYHALHFNGNKTVITNNIFKNTGNISLRVNGNNIKIKNNKFTGNKNTQIQVFGNNNQIYKNIIKNGLGRGISIYGNQNKVFKNKIKSNKLVGIYINGNRNNLTRNNVTGSKKGILIHGDKNIIFKCNIKKNNNIGTHILGNNNQISKNNITKSNKGLFVHGNRNNILQNVIKSNQIGVHNYKSKNNKINYNYIVNEKHNLYGNGSIDADYNWWGKNRLFKVSKSFKINKFVVMYLSAPHSLKFNKTYKISIRFKDNEDKKLKYNIPSLSTRQYFTGEINNNHSTIKANSLKLNIKAVKENDDYVLKIKCDGQILVKKYYWNNGRITSKHPNDQFKDILDLLDYLDFIFGSNSKKGFGGNPYFSKVLTPNTFNSFPFQVNSKGHCTSTDKEFIRFYKNLAVFGDKIEKLSRSPVTASPGLKVMAYVFGRLTKNWGKSFGNTSIFLSKPFLSIPGYSNLDKTGFGGLVIKVVLYALFDIDFNGNLSTGDFLFDLATIAFVVITGGGSLLPKGGKILVKLGKMIPKLHKLLSNKIGKLFLKIIKNSHILKIFKKAHLNWNFDTLFSSLKFIYSFLANPLKTIVKWPLNQFLKHFKDENKLAKWVYNFYNNDLTKIDSYKPLNWVNAMMNLNEFSKKENHVNFYNKIKTKVKEKTMPLLIKGFNSLINLKKLFNKFPKNINLHKLIRRSTIKKSNRFKRKSNKKFINKSPARIRTNYVAVKNKVKNTYRYVSNKVKNVYRNVSKKVYTFGRNLYQRIKF